MARTKSTDGGQNPYNLFSFNVVGGNNLSSFGFVTNFITIRIIQSNH